MGKKKRRRINPEEVFWCYYCDKQFNDSDTLISHQKQRHFKCHVCRKMLSSAGGMVIHVTQVHKEQVRKVPYALKGRDDLTLNIVGMDGVPQDMIDAKLKALGYQVPSREKVASKAEKTGTEAPPSVIQVGSVRPSMMQPGMMMQSSGMLGHPGMMMHHHPGTHGNTMHRPMIVGGRGHLGMVPRGPPGLGPVYSNSGVYPPQLMAPQRYGQYPPPRVQQQQQQQQRGMPPPPLIQPAYGMYPHLNPAAAGPPPILQVPGGAPPTLLPPPQGPPQGPPPSLSAASVTSSPPPPLLSSSSSSSSDSTTSSKSSPTVVVQPDIAAGPPSLPPTPADSNGNSTVGAVPDSKNIPTKPILVYAGTGELSMEEKRAQKYRLSTRIK